MSDRGPGSVQPKDTQGVASIVLRGSGGTSSLALVTDAGRLVSRRADSPPAIDGEIDDVWDTAELLRVPLTWGMDGTEHALDVELRALHTDETVHFLAQWPGAPPSGQENLGLDPSGGAHGRSPQPEGDAILSALARALSASSIEMIISGSVIRCAR